MVMMMLCVQIAAIETRLRRLVPAAGIITRITDWQPADGSQCVGNYLLASELLPRAHLLLHPGTAYGLEVRIELTSARLVAMPVRLPQDPPARGSRWRMIFQLFNECCYLLSSVGYSQSN